MLSDLKFSWRQPRWDPIMVHWARVSSSRPWHCVLKLQPLRFDVTIGPQVPSRVGLFA
jgi:hypothetical protein